MRITYDHLRETLLSIGSTDIPECAIFISEVDVIIISDD